jgi:hypothetical protein
VQCTYHNLWYLLKAAGDVSTVRKYFPYLKSSRRMTWVWEDNVNKLRMFVLSGMSYFSKKIKIIIFYINRCTNVVESAWYFTNLSQLLAYADDIDIIARTQGALKEACMRDGWCQEVGEKNWRNAARNKDGSQKLLKKAWAQAGLLCQWWWYKIGAYLHNSGHYLTLPLFTV